MSKVFEISNRNQAEALEQLSQEQKYEITTINLQHREWQKLELHSLIIQHFPSLTQINMPNSLKIESLLIHQCQTLQNIRIPHHACIRSLKIDDLPKLTHIDLGEGSMIDTLSLTHIKSGLYFTFAYRAKISKIMHHYEQCGQPSIYVEKDITQSGTFDF